MIRSLPLAVLTQCPIFGFGVLQGFSEGSAEYLWVGRAVLEADMATEEASSAPN